MPQADYFGLLPAVLQQLRDYPDIVLDWRNGNQQSHADREQVDVGIRIGPPPDNGFIVKTIAPLHMQTAMSPDLLARLGAPQSVADLQQRYPLIGLVNSNNGKIFEWEYPEGSFVPERPAFLCNQLDSAFQALLHGRAVCQLSAASLRRYLKNGSLITVLPEAEMHSDWQLYVYRPKRHQQTARVKRVFDILVAQLDAYFEEWE